MHVDTVDPWRTADASRLASALREVRNSTLGVFDAYVKAGMLLVPQTSELNPPLWELGHIGWFQELWTSRNPLRDAGERCDPAFARLPSVMNTSDSLYDSSAVAHDTRWNLPLPSVEATKDYLAATLQNTLNLLETTGQSDDALYFYRLVLFHEAMHLEAAIYMAQVLGVAMDVMLLSTPPNATKSIASQLYFTPASSQISIKNTVWTLGGQKNSALNSPEYGFAFDNELGLHAVPITAFDIDSQAVRWRSYLQFVQATGRALPRYVRKADKGYKQQHFGHWQALDMQAAAVHLSWHDAQAYCAWAGRRLPTEAEWECAALSSTEPAKAFAWGEVWEWTSSTFAPYPGFTPHPYRDYSEPWFHSRPVLRGACLATQPMMRNAKYRNYFMAERTDIFAGFRTCAL